MKALVLLIALLLTSTAHATEQCDRYAKFSAYPTEQLSESDSFWADNERVTTAARAAEYYKQWCDQSRLPYPKIGMSAKTATNWGKPKHVNRTTTAKGNVEQWVYGDGNYLYFTNGRLTAIQN